MQGIGVGEMRDHFHLSHPQSFHGFAAHLCGFIAPSLRQKKPPAMQAMKLLLLVVVIIDKTEIIKLRIK